MRKDRNSDDWYLGSITNENARKLDVQMSFLEPGKEYNATIYKDPVDGGWESKPEEIIINNVQFKQGDQYTIELPPGGGQAIRFTPQS